MFVSCGEKLDKLITRQDDTKQYKLRPNSNTNVDKKNIDNTFQELSLDLVRLNKNFECLIECVKTVLVHIDELNIIRTKIETLNDRITQLEMIYTLQATASFEGNQFHTEQSNRIAKLEYVTSGGNARTGYYKLSSHTPASLLTPTTSLIT